ncbi:MAG: hypothetical protein L6E13_08295 [Firmicutes bacterium]|nr:hypothetical protein [Bacillota bacterium]
MADWERELTEALQEGPRWPGDPDRLWQRIAARLPAAPAAGTAGRLAEVQAREGQVRGGGTGSLGAASGRLRPGWRRVAAGAVATAAAVAGLGLLGTALRPGPGGLAPATGESTASLGVRGETRVLGEPRPGSPLRFAVAVAGEAGSRLQVQSGALEVRTPLGDLVWEAPIPEFASLDLGEAESRRAEVVWPAAGSPGHYRAGIRLVTVDPRGRVEEVGLAPAEIFIPYPAGAVRLGQVPVARPITRGPVTARVERITLGPDRALVHFALTGSGLAGGFQWSLLTPAGIPHPHLGTDYRQEEGRVVGVAAFEPVPAPIRTLVVRLGRVGVAQDGGEVTELPYVWEWEVPLDPGP